MNYLKTNPESVPFLRRHRNSTYASGIIWILVVQQRDRHLTIVVCGVDLVRSRRFVTEILHQTRVNMPLCNIEVGQVALRSKHILGGLIAKRN